jgi:hypothetical protein
VTAYVFHLVSAAGAVEDVQERNLPDDRAAIDWMGGEIVGHSQELRAYRSGETTPFALRAFGEDVRVVER